MLSAKVNDSQGFDLTDSPSLSPGVGQVRVRVAYAGINRADILQRMGMYPAPKGVPADVPGLEFSGVVDAVGPGVFERRVGEKVFGLVAGGAYAEEVLVHERELALVPDGLSMRDAAAVPEAFITAYDALVVRGRLTPGEEVLVTAVGSGVGTAAVQIARALGCSVTGTSRTADKLKGARDLGLTHGVLAKGSEEDLGRALAEGQPLGFDVSIDLVGGKYVEAELTVMKSLGRIVVVGMTGGSSANLQLGLLLKKRLSIVGTVLRARPLEEKIEAATLLRKTIVPWLAEKRVRPIVDGVFPLAKVMEAHLRVQSNDTFGKVLLSVTGD